MATVTQFPSLTFMQEVNFEFWLYPTKSSILAGSRMRPQSAVGDGTIYPIQIDNGVAKNIQINATTANVTWSLNLSNGHPVGQEGTRIEISGGDTAQIDFDRDQMWQRMALDISFADIIGTASERTRSWDEEGDLVSDNTVQRDVQFEFAGIDVGLSGSDQYLGMTAVIFTNTAMTPSVIANTTIEASGFVASGTLNIAGVGSCQLYLSSSFTQEGDNNISIAGLI